MSQPALLTGSVNSTSIYVQGRSYPPGGIRDGSNSINRVVVSPNFFAVMEIPLMTGRTFTDGDSTGAEGRDHQRDRGADVFREREPARAPLRIERREQQSARDRRRAARRERRRRP